MDTLASRAFAENGGRRSHVSNREHFKDTTLPVPTAGASFYGSNLISGFSNHYDQPYRLQSKHRSAHGKHSLSGRSTLAHPQERIESPLGSARCADKVEHVDTETRLRRRRPRSNFSKESNSAASTVPLSSDWIQYHSEKILDSSRSGLSELPTKKRRELDPPSSLTESQVSYSHQRKRLLASRRSHIDMNTGKKKIDQSISFEASFRPSSGESFSGVLSRSPQAGRVKVPILGRRMINDGKMQAKSQVLDAPPKSLNVNNLAVGPFSNTTKQGPYFLATVSMQSRADYALFVASAAAVSAENVSLRAIKSFEILISAKIAGEVASRAVIASEADALTCAQLQRISGYTEVRVGLRELTSRIIKASRRLQLSKHKDSTGQSVVPPMNLDLAAPYSPRHFWIMLSRENGFRASLAYQLAAGSSTSNISPLEACLLTNLDKLQAHETTRDAAIYEILLKEITCRWERIHSTWDKAVCGFLRKYFQSTDQSCNPRNGKKKSHSIVWQHAEGVPNMCRENPTQQFLEAQMLIEPFKQSSPQVALRGTNRVPRSLRNNSRMAELLVTEEKVLSALLVSTARESHLRQASALRLPASSPVLRNGSIADSEMLFSGHEAAITNWRVFHALGTDQSAREDKHATLDNADNNLWTDIEKIIFLDKFVQYPKNFSRIATFLSRKDARDCVRLYYDTKYKIDFKALLREHQQRRRGKGGCWSVTQHAVEFLGGSLSYDTEQSAVWFRLPLDHHISA